MGPYWERSRLARSRLPKPGEPMLRPAAFQAPNSADAALPAGAGRQDPAEEVQIDDQGDDEHQAPPAARGAQHNDDDGDPHRQQQPDHQR
jgi:hypothetical protein